jgi:hypothetical protein
MALTVRRTYRHRLVSVSEPIAMFGRLKEAKFVLVTGVCELWFSVAATSAASWAGGAILAHVIGILGAISTHVHLEGLRRNFLLAQR